MKEFPWEFEARKPILVWPDGSDTIGGDILEIGPGRGDLLMDLAEALPDKRVVAIEIVKKRYYKLIPRIEKRAIDNIQLICGDARIVLTNRFDEQSFDKVYILFPDPWPKKRHALKRLLYTDFIDLVARFIRVGGDLYMATDVDWYAQWAAINAESIPLLENQGGPFVTADSLFNYAPTFFEQKWREEGREIFYMWFKRT